MTCSSCKNLDEKKKVDGAVSGAKYYCKKNKCYVYGYNVCDKYTSCYRDTDTCNKIYREGKDWDNDKHSGSFYMIIGLILLVILIIAFLCNPSLYGM